MVNLIIGHRWLDCPMPSDVVMHTALIARSLDLLVSALSSSLAYMAAAAAEVADRRISRRALFNFANSGFWMVSLINGPYLFPVFCPLYYKKGLD